MRNIACGKRPYASKRQAIVLATTEFSRLPKQITYIHDKIAGIVIDLEHME